MKTALFFYDKREKLPNEYSRLFLPCEDLLLNDWIGMDRVQRYRRRLDSWSHIGT